MKISGTTARTFLIINFLLLALCSCVFQEWGIIIENRSTHEINEVRISEDGSNWYQIKLSKNLKPGDSCDYFFVDYGYYKYYKLKVLSGDDRYEFIGPYDLLENLQVDFPQKAKLIIPNN